MGKPNDLGFTALEKRKLVFYGTEKSMKLNLILSEKIGIKNYGL